jgi:hypothetical protein
MSELLKINVSDHTEKKNGLTYLSWAWAWAEVLKLDPEADWTAHEYQCKVTDGNGFGFTTLPCMLLPDGSAMVKTTVTIKGISRDCMLPVMDHRNKAIKQPDAFAINTAIMRCMTKTISMHGLGLYIYAGEDLPEKDVRHSGTSGAEDLVPEARRDELDNMALEMIEGWRAGHGLAVARDYYALESNDEKVYLWKCFAAESKMRAEIKANSPSKAASNVVKE